MSGKDKKTVVFGYARVSTDNQLENYSIDEQTERLKSYCRAKGWSLLKTYVDGGYSGSNTDRPALQQMLEAVRENKIDAVVVYKLDRLSRSQKDTLTLIEDEFLAHGTDFVSINENFDTSTPFGRAMIGILSVFAQLEKDQITERFTMGRIGRGKAGYFHGGGNAPTGYDYIGGRLIINEYEAIQVREAFDLFNNGKSINAIWHILSNKYTTKWTSSKVRNVLKNSLYIGKVKFRGEEYIGAHTPILNLSSFESANRILNSFDRENEKTPAQKRPFRASYLLSGLIYCTRCGARYSANHGYYKCYSRAKSSPRFVIDPDCMNENWKIEELDALVIRQIDQIVSSESSMQKVIKIAETKKNIQIDKESILKKVSQIDTRVDKLIELYQINGIPMEKLTKQIHDLSSEKAILQTQLGKPDEVPATELFLSAASNYINNYKTADIDNKRALVASLIAHISINGQSVNIKWRM